MFQSKSYNDKRTIKTPDKASNKRRPMFIRDSHQQQTEF